MTINRYLIALVLVSSGAFAQNQPEGDTVLGAALRSRPDYDGSDRQTIDVVPVLRYSQGLWFARTGQGILEGGARLAIAGGVAAGVQLAYEPGPLDADPGASLGAHLEWTTKVGRAPFSALARLRNQLDSDRGRQLDARLTLGVYGNSDLRAGVFGQASWASEKHLLAYYDVRGSGLLYTSVGALGSYDVSHRWVVVAFAELRRLADEPARSAFVHDRTNNYVYAGAAYRF